MGFAKREIERQEAIRGVATAIALRGRAIVECENHEGIYMDNYEHEDAYRLANSLFTRGDPLVAEFSTRRALSDAVKAAIDESGFECGLCEKWLRD